MLKRYLPLLLILFCLLSLLTQTGHIQTLPKLRLSPVPTVTLSCPTCGHSPAQIMPPSHSSLPACQPLSLQPRPLATQPVYRILPPRLCPGSPVSPSVHRGPALSSGQCNLLSSMVLDSRMIAKPLGR